jgi:hypothetical protein
LECPVGQVNHWRKAGLLNSIRFSDKPDRLYEKPTAAMIEEIRSRQRRESWKMNHSQPRPSGAV